RITLPLMRRAFRNVRRNRGAAGIDRESLAAFEINLGDNLLALMRRLKDGSYKPLPLRRVWIPKGQGQRPLGIPAVPDRVAEEVADGNILDLVERFLKAGVMEDGVFAPTVGGTPQGGVISPLLANIALNSLDWQLHDAGYRFVRYADDFVVLCRNEVQVQEAHDLVQRHLTSLGLTLSAEKTKTTKFRDGFAFLGFAISAWSVTMRPKSVEKFKAKVRELTPRHHNLDATLINKLNSVIRGTAYYFATSFSHVGDLFRGLDRW